MIEYFKYTTGESFTLSGADYSGFVNVRDGVAYTGKTFSVSSKILQPQDTFFANCILDKLEFDRTVTSVDRSTVLTKPEISPRRVIDQSFIDTNLQIFNQNNLNLYALNIISQTDLLNFKNSAKDGNAYFLGLSSGKFDIRNNDTKLPKDNIYPLQIDPFSYINKVPGVNVLDDTIDSTLFVYNDETYFYFTTTPTASHTFSGSFIKNTTLVPIQPDQEDGETLFKGGTRFTYDNSTDILYSLSAGSDVIDLNLYDNSFVNPCGKLKLVDKIVLNENIIDQTVKIGNNLLGYKYLEIDEDEAGSSPAIAIRNKYSNKLIKTIFCENETIIAFDIRDSDDSILVLTEPSQAPPEVTVGNTGDGGVFYLYQLDAEKITDLSTNLNPKVVYRHTPTYEFTAVNEDDIEIFFSQNDSNIFVLNDEGFITTRFISNPSEASGFANPENLQYLPDMYFNNTGERFNLIQKKFNSNTLRSNYLNFINYIITKNDTDLFFLMHNIGRIYLFKESNLLYQNFVPLDLKNLYEEITSCESSLGISLNSEIQNIVKDTVSIFLNLSLIPSKAVIDGIPILREYTTYKGLDINFRDIEFHENEAVDYNVISRVFNELFELQEQILNSVLNASEEPVEEDDFIGTIVVGDAEFEELNITSVEEERNVTPGNTQPSEGGRSY
jgi:hypothetical protein